MITLVRELVIDRRKWYRGQGSEESSLLRTTDKKQCCIGLWASASGISNKSLQEESILSIMCRHAKLKVSAPKGSFIGPLLIALKQLYARNDVRGLAKCEREKQLTLYFKKLGVTVTFAH